MVKRYHYCLTIILADAIIPDHVMFLFQPADILPLVFIGTNNRQTTAIIHIFYSC